jgi:AcrR family transcriptional regulator
MSEDRLTRKQRQARTRISLIRSAARVFARRGLQRGTIDEVAADAGFTKGAFYANFSSKEELFLAMLDEGFAARLRQVRELSGSDPEIDRSEIVKRARVEGEDYAHHLAADPDWQRLFFEFVVHATREESFRGELVRRYDGLRMQVAEVFAQRAAELGVRPTVDVESLARMIFAMANGFALERLLEPEETSEESYGAMLAIFFTGLRALGAEASSAVADAEETAATDRAEQYRDRSREHRHRGRGETAATDHAENSQFG